MKHIKFFALFSLVILLMTASACSHQPSPYSFDYPKEITPKYCFENYRGFDPNIRYNECYEFVTAEDRYERIAGVASIEYSAIKDIDDLSFMVCYKTCHWSGKSRWLYVLRRDDCEIEPIMDYTPSKIELCAYEDLFELNPEMIDVEEEPKAYYHYGEYTFSDPILTVDSPEAIAKIMEIAQRPATMTLEENFRERELYPVSYELNPICWNDKPIYVKISFEECSGMVWVGKILTDDEGICYMERCVYVYDPAVETREEYLFVDNDFSGPSSIGWGYPLGEHMNSIISELMTGENE